MSEPTKEASETFDSASFAFSENPSLLISSGVISSLNSQLSLGACEKTKTVAQRYKGAPHPVGIRSHRSILHARYALEMSEHRACELFSLCRHSKNSSLNAWHARTFRRIRVRRNASFNLPCILRDGRAGSCLCQAVSLFEGHSTESASPSAQVVLCCVRS